MKFQIGDMVDVQLCKALKHEFLRCQEAFEEFAIKSKIMFVRNDGDRRTAYSCYNAYVRFIHHLYEFEMGAVIRDRLDTGNIAHTLADKYILSEMHRILRNRREAIIDGSAPDWENDLSYYPSQPPSDFAEKFRKIRNKSSGHVSYERPKMNITDFYRDYHKFVYLMYFEARSWWGRQFDVFPDLDEITAF
ncbi:MAG: hypothetical protein EOP21_04595 [Hyphomicrobiales bacterium]|nr:MAG: hypothetical protein EOP21_04595 [Hyphomicrobiales bacterium]